MSTVVTSGEQHMEEGERRTERDLGAIANEVEHLAADVAEHTTTLQGLKEDREWITRRFEALERDLAAIPKVPEELTTTFSESIANLTHRLERLEAEDDGEEGTEPPHRHDENEDEHRDDPPRRNILDSIF